MRAPTRMMAASTAGLVKRRSLGDGTLMEICRLDLRVEATGRRGGGGHGGGAAQKGAASGAGVYAHALHHYAVRDGGATFWSAPS